MGWYGGGSGGDGGKEKRLCCINHSIARIEGRKERKKKNDKVGLSTRARTGGDSFVFLFPLFLFSSACVCIPYSILEIELPEQRR